jgi:hypothetical protein
MSKVIQIIRSSHTPGHRRVALLCGHKRLYTMANSLLVLGQEVPCDACLLHEQVIEKVIVSADKKTYQIVLTCGHVNGFFFTPPFTHDNAGEMIGLTARCRYC